MAIHLFLGMSKASPFTGVLIFHHPHFTSKDEIILGKES